MQNWIPDLSQSAGPKYLSIAEAISRDIAAGVLAAGERLPPQRVLADALSVDLTTVTRAYGEAQRLGLIEGSGRRGSFIKAKAGALVSESAHGNVPESSEAGMNSPPENFGGTLTAQFRKSVQALLGGSSGVPCLGYQKAGGAVATRRAGQALLARRGIVCDEDTVRVSAGGQHALHAIFSSHLGAGDVLAVCQFVYPGLISLAQRFGVSLRVVESDEQGMVPEALNKACQDGQVKAVYLVPSNDNPTTATMGPIRRREIAAAIESLNLILIEDDAYGFLHEEILPAVGSFCPSKAWYIASVSKVLAPALRVAWLRAPDVTKAWRVTADMHETAIMAPPLNAAIVADWVANGTFDLLVGELRDEAVRRQAFVSQCMAPGSYAADPQGYHLWIPVGLGANVHQLCDAVSQQGMIAVSSDAFSVERSQSKPSLRVSIGGSLTDERLRRGLLLLNTINSERIDRKISLV